MKDSTQIKIAAIGSIAFLESIALLKGIDGVLFSIVIAAISGLAGYQIRGIWNRTVNKDGILQR